MTKEKGIAIKGIKGGVVIQIPEEMSFELVQEQLESHLKEATAFFKDTRVSVFFKGKTLNSLEYSQLVDIIINKTSINCERIISDISNKQLDLELKHKLDTQFVKGTVRSGQRIESEGHVVVLGDVNPSAEVIARGNIIVLGHLNGNVQAGFPNYNDTFVAAFSMQPNLLKIGEVIGRSGDEKRSIKKIKKYAEIAYEVEGGIVIEPLDYKTISQLPVEL